MITAQRRIIKNFSSTTHHAIFQKTAFCKLKGRQSGSKIRPFATQLTAFYKRLVQQPADSMPATKQQTPICSVSSITRFPLI